MVAATSSTWRVAATKLPDYTNEDDEDGPGRSSFSFCWDHVNRFSIATGLPAEHAHGRAIALSMLTLTFGACAGIKGQSGGAAGTSGSAGASGTAGADASAAGGTDARADAAFEAAVIPPTCDGSCTDFSVPPILEVGVPANAPTMFTGAPTGAGPCVTEPEDGALFPANWLRPRVKFTPTVPGTLHEIRVHADMEQDDLLGYTTSDTWTMPKAIWLALTHSVIGTQKQFDVTVTVRALGGGATSVTFSIPPVKAPGSVVFWAAVPADLGNPGPMSSSLQGFTVGDESTVQALGVRDGRACRGPRRDVGCRCCGGGGRTGRPDQGVGRRVGAHRRRAAGRDRAVARQGTTGDRPPRGLTMTAFA